MTGLFIKIIFILADEIVYSNITIEFVAHGMELVATLREQFGKKTAGLRTRSLVPGELYGRGVANIHVTVPLVAFQKAYKAAGENTVVQVVLGKEKFSVLIYDVAHDPLTSVPTHVDLYRVRMDEKLQTKVPIEFIGESAAVKDLGGVLVKTIKEIPVEALPDQIPHHLTVDLSSLKEIGNSIHVGALAVPAGVKVLIDAKMVVVTVKAKMTEEEEAALASKGDVETVKVEAEEKKDERAAAKDAATEGEAAPAGKAVAGKAPAAKTAAKTADKK